MFKYANRHELDTSIGNTTVVDSYVVRYSTYSIVHRVDFLNVLSNSSSSNNNNSSSSSNNNNSSSSSKKKMIMIKLW